MTYLEFQEFLLRHLWREGDSDLATECEMFVRLGEGRMNRDVLIEDRSVYLDISAEANFYDLPSDIAVIRSVNSSKYGNFSYLTPSALARLKISTGEHDVSPNYSVRGRSLRLAGPMSAALPLPLEVEYYENIPSLFDTDASYILDQYFDLYLYAVLSHTASYLREDPRIVIWKSEYQEALDSVMDFNEKVKYTQGPLHMPLPGNVA